MKQTGSRYLNGVGLDRFEEPTVDPGPALISSLRDQPAAPVCVSGLL